MAQLPDAQKICVVCGENCAGRPRIKDAQGRYACKSCAESRAHSRTPEARNEAVLSDVDPDLISLSLPVSQSALIACPNCKSPLEPGAVFCVSCGFDHSAGRVLKTRVARSKTPKTPRNGRKVSGSTIFLASMVLVVLSLLGASYFVPDALAICALILVLLTLTLWIPLGISACRHHILLGILVFLFPLFAWVHGVFICRNPLLRGLTWLNFAGWAGFAGMAALQSNGQSP